MLLELLETIPFIIVTVINLLIVGKTIYRLLNHKSILDNSRDIDCRFYIYPFFVLLLMSFNGVNNLWKIIMAVSEISMLALQTTIIVVRQNASEPFNECNKFFRDKIIITILMAFGYGLIFWLKSGQP